MFSVGRKKKPFMLCKEKRQMNEKKKWHYIVLTFIIIIIPFRALYLSHTK